MSNRIWFDTEFIEDGKTIDLISIGMCREDGRCFYAENVECDFSKASPWIKENVIPKLAGGGTCMTRKQIASAIVRFAGHEPEFWAYYADYDWVVLCQLFGTMMDLPKGWPMFCMDLKQAAMERGNVPLPKQENNEHNALADARWTRRAWQFVAKFPLAPAEHNAAGGGE